MLHTLNHLASFVCRILAAPFAKMVPAMAFTEHDYLTADGLSLYYREYGAGKDVVICLPGLTRNS
jgi:hypothetical protein